MDENKNNNFLAVSYLTDLLMGAAHSDKQVESVEINKVRDIIKKIIGKKEIPASIEERINNFEPEKLDIKKTVSALVDNFKELQTSKEKKRKIIELIAAIHDIDEVLALEEDEYLGKIAEALKLDPEDYKDLKLEIISVEDLISMEI